MLVGRLYVTVIEKIFVQLLLCVTVFYTTYYMVASVMFGAFKLNNFDGTMPFDFDNFIDFRDCCTSYTDLEKANFISMELTFLLCVLVFVTFLPTRLWDYAITTTVIHIAISCLVMLDFPLNWSWWICLAVALLVMITIGETINYWRRRMKEDKQAVTTPSTTDGPHSVTEQYLSFGSRS